MYTAAIVQLSLVFPINSTLLSFVYVTEYLIASFLYIAYKVTFLFDIVRVDNPVVASSVVFHPTNVQPSFVAVGVKSIAYPETIVSDVFVDDVPPFCE